MDLDTRPPEIYRSTMPIWIKQCSSCGYCASKITTASGEAKKIVQTKAYQNQLKWSGFPEVANRFLCKAMIETAEKHFAEAAWSTIHAAWCFDDHEEDYKEESARFRLQAIAMIQKIRAEHGVFGVKEGVDIAVMVDLLRRAGKFADAQKLIDQCFDTSSRINIKKAMIFQEKLIARFDTGSHTLGAALEDYDRVFGNNYSVLKF